VAVAMAAVTVAGAVLVPAAVLTSGELGELCQQLLEGEKEPSQQPLTLTVATVPPAATALAVVGEGPVVAVVAVAVAGHGSQAAVTAVAVAVAAAVPATVTAVAVAAAVPAAQPAAVRVAVW
jgi:hypothetical protein